MPNCCIICALAPKSRSPKFSTFQLRESIEKMYGGDRFQCFGNCNGCSLGSGPDKNMYMVWHNNEHMLLLRPFSIQFQWHLLESDDNILGTK